MSLAPWGYRRVKKTPLTDGEPAPNELRVTASHTSSRAYVQQAVELLTGGPDGSPPTDTVILKGMGQAIAKTVNIAEVVKRHVPGLHQVAQLGSINIIDELQPLVPGKEPRTVKRNVSTLTVTLSTKELDTSHSGYQPPLDPALVTGGDLTAEPAAGSPTAAGAGGSARRRRGQRYAEQTFQGGYYDPQWGWVPYQPQQLPYGGYDDGGWALRGGRGRGGHRSGRRGGW
eukprot:TRINITY_DN25617_c0_g1_i1.p2 TRINITY_DN25617_c0_g1~~TRINITY_DN25617_c0_g1_i1.p2  ORF type:complete len:229 (+),score=66.54 TRINITY_DN25617_c0_g1_i1:108-794(+)